MSAANLNLGPVSETSQWPIIVSQGKKSLRNRFKLEVFENANYLEDHKKSHYLGDNIQTIIFPVYYEVLILQLCLWD